MRFKGAGGFGLIELMITIAIVAILLAVAFPSFEGSMRSNRVAGATNEMLAALNLARSEAIRNSRGAGMCASTDGTDCDGEDWAEGWMVWSDSNGNGTYDVDEPIVRVKQQSARLTVEGPATPITFDSRGRRGGFVDLSVTMRPDECGGQPLQRTLLINAIGHVSVTPEDCT